jgi:hypothetical protein
MPVLLLVTRTTRSWRPLIARFCPDRLGHNRTVLHESYDAVFGDHVLHHTEAWRDMVREAAWVVWP